MDDALAVLGIVSLALLVSALADRLHTPAPSLLVLAGVGVGFVPGTPGITVSPDVVLIIVLPPLLFAGAQGLPLRELRRVAAPVAALSTGLVALTAVAVAAVLHLIEPRISLAIGFTLGAILSSTDPVAVAALARTLHLPRRLHVLVQGESLFNDATSLVLFQVAVGVAVRGSHVDLGDSLLTFLRLAGGGAGIGLAVALLVSLVGARTTEPLTETALALVVPYLAYLLAEKCSLSGVTAVVVCGVVLAGRADRQRSPAARLQVAQTYEVIVFLLESSIFAVIGLQLPTLIDQLPREDHRVPVAVAGLLLTVLLVRAVVLLPVSLVRRTVDWRPAAVATWAGTRGVVPLAAALSLPVGLAHRSELLVLTSAVVILTLVIQGLTLAPLARRLGVKANDSDVEAEVAAVQRILASAEGGGNPRTALAARREALARLQAEGRISEPTRLRLQHAIDIEEVALES